MFGWLHKSKHCTHPYFPSVHSNSMWLTRQQGAWVTPLLCTSHCQASAWKSGSYFKPYTMMCCLLQEDTQVYVFLLLQHIETLKTGHKFTAEKLVVFAVEIFKFGSGLSLQCFPDICLFSPFPLSIHPMLHCTSHVECLSVLTFASSSSGTTGTYGPGCCAQFP